MSCDNTEYVSLLVYLETGVSDVFIEGTSVISYDEITVEVGNIDYEFTYENDDGDDVAVSGTEYVGSDDSIIYFYEDGTLFVR
jgi:hypothetical protein